MGIKKASATRKKPLKILLFGDSGCGKTHFALQSTPGKILVFDAESGTDLFEGRKGFDFDYWTDDDGLKTASIRELNKAIDYLETPEGRKQYETFVIDPISDIWDNIQAQRLDYKEEKTIEKAKKYNKEIDLDDKNETEVDSFNVKDWSDMKRIYKNMMLRLKNLPQNIILIAREKEISETKPDGSIVRTGEYTYEAEKNTKYAVDFNVRLIFDEKTKKRYAVIAKTRSDEFEKSQRFDSPTFAIFDGLVNKMKNAVQVDKMSEKDENVFTDEEELKNTIAEISVLATRLATSKREAVIEAIKKHHTSANYNGIKDITTAKAVLEELRNVEVI
jgi:GTPase SAR1 family protein